MSIRVALHHHTGYRYDRPIRLGPQIVRLRPAPHSRTPTPSYSLTVRPEEHFVNWQQDPYGNYLARLVFPEPTDELSIDVDLVADLSVINPFEFFLEDEAEEFPFRYDEGLAGDLRPYLETAAGGVQWQEFLTVIDRTPRRTVEFLVDLNQLVQREVGYLVRMEPGVQTPEETLRIGSGSCRDSGWLLVQALRRLGLAARFVSGYLIQLVADQKSLDGPSGPEADFTDLHAWAEVYLPGAGWVGLDPTSGLFAGEGHIPLACSPAPDSAAPISGLVEDAEVDFSFSMEVERIREDPRVTKPYTSEQWSAIDALGKRVDQALTRNDVRLTMGGEPTFVSIDDMAGDEWNVAAVGPEKLRLSEVLLRRLRDRFGPGGILHQAQGKWYPGESLPRWALGCYWRRDGVPVWKNEELFASSERAGGCGPEEANRFGALLAAHLQIDVESLIPAYEDTAYYLWKEQRLPVNVDPNDPRLNDSEERRRLARLLEEGLDRPAGVVLPIRPHGGRGPRAWESGPWPKRADNLFLLPGDSPIGLRLPLDALPWELEAEVQRPFPLDPMAPRPPLPRGEQPQVARGRVVLKCGARQTERPELEAARESSSGLVRTALCIEPRGGRLYVFLPPIDRLEDWLVLIAAIESTAADLAMPVLLEGYPPPLDPRMNHFKVTPDPGVLEVNIHPSSTWDELVDKTKAVYAEARATRLGTEKFDLDGRHTGTGGGNHVTLGSTAPADSPFLRRPDLLKSMLGYWQNHPSLSYLFSGKFIGPTSQAPRVDEGRRDALYELELAFAEVPPRGKECLPWLVDRIFRNLLTDLTGNTHRAEFCIDKLYSPDSSTGRLGIVELRGFEMPPHAQMSLAQQLLIRALVSAFWQEPYEQELVDWGTALHDRFLLPHFVWQDFRSVLADLDRRGIRFEPEWFDAHFEFRFPRIGQITHDGLALELRLGIEPWYVLGEEPGGGGTARFVDSSVERLQVKVDGFVNSRYEIACNGRRVPLHETGVAGQGVGGVRYRAWAPPSCLHPTIPVHAPLRFDVFDVWAGRVVSGCEYYVSHPGGLSHEDFPVNAAAAETRRASRFQPNAHTPNANTRPVAEWNPSFPVTLDLRRSERFV